MRTDIPGSRVLRGDPRYSTLVKGFNLRWDGSPQYVQVVSSTADVVAELQRCIDAGLRPTVRSGGHCYEGWVAQNDGAIIDVSGLNRAGWDPTDEWFYVESGCTNWDVYNHLYRRYGRTLPAGSCYSVGAGGHICGGGYGLLSREFGLTVDWLYGVEVACVDENGHVEIVRATRDSSNEEELDLWWAHTGGGGGNFGIITRYLFRDLPVAPSEVGVAQVAWDWSKLKSSPDAFHQLLRNYGTFFEEHSEPDSRFSSLFALLHLTRFAADHVSLTVQTTDSDNTQLEEFLGFMNQGMGVGRTSARGGVVGHHRLFVDAGSGWRMPWLDATQAFDGSGFNQRGKYKSAYMKKPFSGERSETLLKWLLVENAEFPANPQALVQVDSYGARINAVGSHETAVPQRSSILKLQYQTYWRNETDDDANFRWINGLYDEMYGPDGPVPDENVDGCYVNYPDGDLKNWAALYYGDNYARLQKAKAFWDPHNVFHHAQSIGS